MVVWIRRLDGAHVDYVGLPNLHRGMAHMTYDNIYLPAIMLVCIMAMSPIVRGHCSPLEFSDD